MAGRIIIRTIKFGDYSVANQRFRHQAVFDPYGDGISVFLEECAIEKSPLCIHIATFYPKTVDNPVFFWKIDEEVLTNYAGLEKAKLEQSDSFPNAEGIRDECHHDIILEDQTSKEFRRISRNFAQDFCKPPYLYICIDGDAYQISTEQYSDLEKWLTARGLK